MFWTHQEIVANLLHRYYLADSSLATNAETIVYDAISSAINSAHVDTAERTMKNVLSLSFATLAVLLHPKQH
jgi:hypothetical protein